MKKNADKAEGADWIVTIPRQIEWAVYAKELAAVEDWKSVANYRLPRTQRNLGFKSGDRCFIIWGGYVQGWMEVVGLWYSNGFTCDATGTKWPEGYYLQRSGPFHPITPMPMRGFQGVRRYHHRGGPCLKQHFHAIRAVSQEA